MKHAFFGLILLAWNIPLLHCALSTISLFWIKSGCSYRSYCSLWTKSSSLDQLVRLGSRQSTIVDGDPNTESRENQAMARAAIAQLCSTPDKIANLVAIARCAGLAKKSGASMLFLPENCGFLGEHPSQTLLEAEAIHIQGEPVISKDIQIKREFVYSTLKRVIADCEAASSLERNDSLLHIVRMVKEEIHYNETEKGCISIVDCLRQIARDSNLWISGGGIHEAGAPPLTNSDGNRSSRVYNTHIIINEQGEVVCRYRKIHLFEVSIPSQQLTLRESDTTAPGDSIVVCHDSPIGSLGLSICYDVRFPEQYAELAKHGAQVLLVPSAFTVPTGQAHWHTLLRARAIENQCYVLAAAQYGVHNQKRTSYGHSIAIDPWGVVLADAGGFDGPGTTLSSTNNEPQIPPTIITCDIDLNHLSSIRERMPIQKHRDQAKLLG